MGRKQRFIRFVISEGRRSEGAHAHRPITAVCLLLKAPYAGANRIRFQGTLSAWFRQAPPLLRLFHYKPYGFASLPSGGGVILGDAAHAMLPFYGQGMNAGLEDVRVLFEHIDGALASSNNSTSSPKEETSTSLTTALQSYTTTRVPDAHTINDLASANYAEMHSGVRSPIYLFRKRVEEFLSDKFPSSGFATQYARVSFSNERYSLVRKNVEQQGKVLLRGIVGLGLMPILGWAGWWVWRYERASRTGVFAAKGGIGLGSLIGGLGERVGRLFT